MPTRQPRKPIADLIEELKSWLPNYDQGADSYPHTLFRILASLPGGEELEDIGYEPMPGIGWHEADQLGRVLEGIQDKTDVEDIVAALMHEDEEEAPPPPPKRSRKTREPVPARAAPGNWGPGTWTPSEARRRRHPMARIGTVIPSTYVPPAPPPPPPDDAVNERRRGRRPPPRGR